MLFNEEKLLDINIGSDENNGNKECLILDVECNPNDFGKHYSHY